MLAHPIWLSVIVLLLSSKYTTSQITCGPSGVITMVGAPEVVPIATAWATFYQGSCGNHFNITPSTDLTGVEGVCSSVGRVDVALRSRPLSLAYSAPVETSNGWQYTCSPFSSARSRKIIEVEVGTDGIALVSSPGGIASKCIASIKGLTLRQILWIYTDDPTAEQQKNSTFDGFPVPNSDGNNNTHLWSELCVGVGCNCPATEIKIAGSNVFSPYYTFFVNNVLQGVAIATDRPNGYFGVFENDPASILDYITRNTEAIAFLSFASYYQNSDKVDAAAVAHPDDGVYRFPQYSEYLTGQYPLSYQLYMEVRSDNTMTLNRLLPFFSFAFSSQGDSVVGSTGRIPLVPNNKLRMLSRLNAPGGVNLNRPDLYAVYCKLVSVNYQFQYYLNTLSVKLAGSSVVYPLAQLWGFIYQDICSTYNEVSITVVGGGNSFGAQTACASVGLPPGVGMMSRSFLASEAARPASGNGYDFKCKINTNQTAREFPVATDGIVLAFGQGGVAAKCIATLPGGGLSVDQVRWAFSVFNESKLQSLGWKPSSVPNSDGNDGTHLWSELCSGSTCNCPNTEIKIGGSSVLSDYFSFFSQKVLKGGAGETVNLNRPLGYYSNADDNSNDIVSFLSSNNQALAFIPYPLYTKNKATIGAASLRNAARSFVAPSDTTLSNGTYNPLSRDLYMQYPVSFPPAFAFPGQSNYLKFGITSDLGDSLTRFAGLAPLSTKKKASITNRFVPPPPSCFSEMSMVEVMGNGVIAMKDLQIGDMVRNGKGTFDLVYSFGHYAPHTVATFLQIYTIGAARPLEISHEHMLWVGGVLVPASMVRVGDYLQLAAAATATGGMVPVRKIKTVVRTGVYAPFTMSGTIAVNNISTSAYVDPQFDFWPLVIGGYSAHVLTHMFQAPHRLVCKLTMGHHQMRYCKMETYDERGMTRWASLLLFAYDWVVKQSTWIKWVVSVPVVLVYVTIYCIETILGSWHILAVAVVAWFVTTCSIQKCKMVML